MTLINLSAWQSFSREWANFNELTTIAITLDIDFAPEFMIEHVMDMLISAGARATIFVTHDSPYLRSLESHDFELAFHPNLAPYSTQGSDLIEIVSRLKKSYPNARGNRFHLLHHSYRELARLAGLGVTYDASTLRFNCPYQLPAWHADLNLTLMCYSWEDGVCESARLPMTLGSIDLATPGMKILNFHPVNVYLNGPDAENRLRFFREIPNFSQCTPDAVEPFRQTGEGSAHVLRQLLSELHRRRCRLVLLREIDEAFRHDVVES